MFYSTGIGSGMDLITGIMAKLGSLLGSGFGRQMWINVNECQASNKIKNKALLSIQELCMYCIVYHYTALSLVIETDSGEDYWGSIVRLGWFSRNKCRSQLRSPFHFPVNL